MVKTNFTFGLIPIFFVFFDIDLLFPRIRALQATFKAVLIAVFMTNGLQTNVAPLHYWIAFKDIVCCLKQGR